MTKDRIEPAPFDTYVETEIVVRGRDGRERIPSPQGEKGKAKGRSELRVVTSVGYMGEKDRKRFAFQIARFVKGVLEARSRKPVEEIVTEALRIAEGSEPRAATVERRRVVAPAAAKPDTAPAETYHAEPEVPQMPAAPGVPGLVPPLGYALARSVARGEPERTMSPCQVIATEDGEERGWGCCVCQTFNAFARSACRQCEHPRCGVVS